MKRNPSAARLDCITNGGQAECQIAAAIPFVPEMLTNCRFANLRQPETAFKASKSLHAAPLLSSFHRVRAIHKGRSPEISIAKPKISSGFDEYTPLNYRPRGEQRKARAFSPLENEIWGYIYGNDVGRGSPISTISNLLRFFRVESRFSPPSWKKKILNYMPTLQLEKNKNEYIYN